MHFKQKPWVQGETDAIIRLAPARSGYGRMTWLEQVAMRVWRPGQDSNL